MAKGPAGLQQEALRLIWVQCHYGLEDIVEGMGLHGGKDGINGLLGHLLRHTGNRAAAALLSLYNMCSLARMEWDQLLLFGMVYLLTLVLRE